MSADGARYEGEWSQGKRHGKGKQISLDGIVEDGIFVNGEKQLGSDTDV